MRKSNFSTLYKISRAGLIGTSIALLYSLSVGAAPSESLVKARIHSQDGDISAVTFRMLKAFFPTENVKHKRTAKLKRDLVDLNPDVMLGKEKLSFQDALKKTYTNALLVIKDGKIVYEQYLNGSTEDSQFISWSMAKSVTSILVGAAVRRGDIKDLDDPVENYLDDLKGTAFEGATIRNLLMMRGGTNYKEQSRDGKPHSAKIAFRGMYLNKTRYADVRGLGLKNINKPGSTFNYSTLTAGLLGRVVEKATGMSLAKFTEKVLWKPAGMEADAYWLLDGEPGVGVALAGGGLNAVLRDYGRIGLMMLNGGRANGRQIVSKDWVKQSTQYTGDKPVIKGAPRGYQYQWWTMMGTKRFEAIGIYGQFISIDPATNTVIVKMGHWPAKGGMRYNIESLTLFETIRRALTTKP